jgi:hypothetical protein
LAITGIDTPTERLTTKRSTLLHWVKTATKTLHLAPKTTHRPLTLRLHTAAKLLTLHLLETLHHIIRRTLLPTHRVLHTAAKLLTAKRLALHRVLHTAAKLLTAKRLALHRVLHRLTAKTIRRGKTNHITYLS